MATQRPEYPALVMPANVERTVVKIWSNGVALDGDVYRLKALTGGERAPAVVLSHGWGGTKGTCERYAALFAHHGLIALTFTHAGWGESESRFPRELVDPLEWIQGFRSAVDYIEGEPNVDADRIGAWGTSFGGGVAMYSAAHDERIKALSVQVAMVSKFYGPGGLPYAKQRAIDLARGKLGPVASDAVPGLPGTLNVPKALQYDVVEQIDGLKVPTLLMDAENEGFFDKRLHCIRVHEKLKAANITVAYKVIPKIDHYGIYFEGYDEGSSSALAWFREHLGRSAR